MKQRTIWTIAVIMGLSFLALLLLQLQYIRAMAEMKKEQFDESVNRALYQASRNLELNETLRYLEKDLKEKSREENNRNYSPFELKTITTKPSKWIHTLQQDTY